MRTRKSLTVQELVDIYFQWKKDNLSISDSARSLGLPFHAVRSARNNLLVYWAPKVTQRKQKVNHNYLQAVNTIRVKLMADARRGKKFPQTNHTNHTNHTAAPQKAAVHELTSQEIISQATAKLDQAFDTLKAELKVYAETIIKTSVDQLIERNRVLSEENEKLAERNEGLEAVHKAAKHSNWFSNLTRHFNGRVPNLD